MTLSLVYLHIDGLRRLESIFATSGTAIGRQPGTWQAGTKVGLLHHVMHAIYESVQVLSKAFEDHKDVFPQVPKRNFGSRGFSTLLVHSIWTAFFDQCLIKLPTSEHVSPQHGGAWTLESFVPSASSNSHNCAE